MATFSKHKLAIIGVLGLGAVAIGLLAASGTANAATNPSSPAALDPTSTRGQAAIALASAIQTAGGYEGSQGAAVAAYQSAAGLAVDGYPGTNTMTQLGVDLAAMGTNSSTGQTYSATYPLIGTLAKYDWTSSTGWVSGNVPATFVNNSAAWMGTGTSYSNWNGTTVGT